MYALKLINLLGILFLVMNNTGCTNTTSRTSATETSAPQAVPPASPFTDLSETTDLRKLLCQNWEHKEDAEDADAGDGGDGMEKPYRGIALFEDGTATENPRDNIRLGRWTFDESKKVLQLEFTGGASARYKIGAIGPRELVLQNLSDKKKTTFQADGKLSLVPTLNPFHPGNNGWRIKPARKESDVELKERTVAAVDFYAKFLEDNAAREGNVVSFIGFPGCFKWYNGGISISSEQKLGSKWINCFYNKTQALQGRQMLEDIISKKYKWDKKETNWVKQSADVLKQIKDTLNSL